MKLRSEVRKPTKPDVVVFEPGAFMENYKRLLVFAYILPETRASDEEVKEVQKEVEKLVPSYLITSGGELHATAGSQEYDHASALLLRYLADHHDAECFAFGPSDMRIVCEYYSAKMIEEARLSDRPERATLRFLLSPQPHIRLWR